MPSLDIIIPAPNAAHCLDRTLRAIADQSVPPNLSFGTIVVNDGSTDDTSAVIDHWSGKSVRRDDYRKIRSRSAAALNAGVSAITADYVLLARLADSGRRHALEKFDWSEVGAAYRRTISELIADTR